MARRNDFFAKCCCLITNTGKITGVVGGLRNQPYGEKKNMTFPSCQASVDEDLRACTHGWRFAGLATRDVILFRHCDHCRKKKNGGGESMITELRHLSCHQSSRVNSATNKVNEVLRCVPSHLFLKKPRRPRSCSSLARRVLCLIRAGLNEIECFGTVRA